MKNASWFMRISKMNVRSLKLLVVVLGLVFGAFIVVDNFVSCDYESQKVIPNRSNSKILVQYSLSCPALAGSTNMTFVNSKWRVYFPSMFEPFFTADYDYDGIIKAQWIGEGEVQIVVPPVLRVYQKDEKQKGIKITYVDR